MTYELETWERKHYVAGGGDPFLFYAVFGEIDSSAPLSRGSYRSNGAPDGLDMTSYGPETDADIPASFRYGYLWDQFVENDPDLAAAVAECQHCIVLRGMPADATTLDYLRDTIALITFMIDHGGCVVYDPFMFKWWNPTEWRENIFDPAAPVPRHHVAVLVSEECDPSMKWFHTCGMRKFGRPDISVHDVPPELEDGVVDLCERLIEHQAFGHVVSDGQEKRMASLPSGGIFSHSGDLDDPDFNNVHLDVNWPMRHNKRMHRSGGTR